MLEVIVEAINVFIRSASLDLEAFYPVFLEMVIREDSVVQDPYLVTIGCQCRYHAPLIFIRFHSEN